MTKEFQREDRYIVIKRKHLKPWEEASLRSDLRIMQVGTVDCVVIEHDWPEYEPVWKMIEDRCSEKEMTTNETIEITQADEDAGMVLLAENWTKKPIDEVFATAFAKHRLSSVAEKDAEIERLRKALRDIVGEWEYSITDGHCDFEAGNESGLRTAANIAREALSYKTENEK